MNFDEKMKLFSMANQMAESDLEKVEKKYQLNIRKDVEEAENVDEDYYLQFPQVLRADAAKMSKHYEIFFCLENHIRELVIETLRETFGKDWWDKQVPDTVKQNVEANIKREIDAGVSRRSDDKIDYTTFGELGEIIKYNWDSFGAIFNSKKAVTKIITALNTLRAPIAHCNPLAPDEELRMKLTLKDWFRLME
jgi:hypothetical protein